MDINLGMTQFEAEDKDGNKVNTNFARKQIEFSSNYQLVDWNPELKVLRYRAIIKWLYTTRD